MLTSRWEPLKLPEGTVRFRYARRDDVERIIDMAADAITLSIPKRKEWLKEYTRKMRRREFESLKLNWYSYSQNLKLILAELNNNVIGYLVLMLGVKGSATGYPHAWVSDLFVSERYRRKGIGKRLMEIAEEIARRAGYDYIGLTVTTENERAIKLYSKLGYIEERKIMVKDLRGFKKV